ncbi:hypothetical protein HMPREF1140_2101 [Lachnoanaerobaculum sp. ICM7]|uniref:hypothetical protein n=1 Tax=Lachnoanaerobaculum sp. ICM7 TaxID=936594 RepID=UPI00027A4B9F|nr:hypothetical protein [Lachnoanaerobaculum sp. ICM7]EJP24043.1 hypothetical protein HMPREF1140_2101 [Lachnoanaerobaculum sp. ICM7]
MKRSNIIYGLTCIILSGISLYIAIIFDANKMSGVFYGLTGALGVGGIVSIAQYFYWKRHNEKYEEKLEIERIEQQDELKQKLRDKSGRYAYFIGMSITALSIMAYSLLGVLNIMDTEYIVTYLSIYLISQLFIGIIVFHHLLRKYN